MYGDLYGQWISFNYTKVHSGDAFGVPRGLLVLEAQQELMGFLLALVERILGDQSLLVQLAVGKTNQKLKWDETLQAGPVNRTRKAFERRQYLSGLFKSSDI